MTPLFLHPSDNTSSIQVDKLQGSSDYRAWRRSMEINLSSKRKLGSKRKLSFVTGRVTSPTDDILKAEMWDTCNNTVIAWITSNVSPTIMRSIMYMTSAKDNWSNLEKRFSLSNGSRKYKLCRKLYDLKQANLSITEYYTSMKMVWEELDTLTLLPAVTVSTDEVLKLLEEIHLQKEELRLFQFLNGLDDQYNSQCSQLLLQSPLPTVELACSALEQEEAQRCMLGLNKGTNDMMAMYRRSAPDRNLICTTCGGKGHRGPKGNNSAVKSTSSHKFAGVIHSDAGISTHGFSQEQLAQLANLMPQLTMQYPAQSETDDEIDYHFSGMLYSNKDNSNANEWIIDSGATHHMTGNIWALKIASKLSGAQSINLPTGEGIDISHKGQQTSCPYMPQQNARVERKHRHILELARGLRFHSGMPLEMWGACVMTSVHLINKLSYVVLHNKSSYEMLYKYEPEYDHLRVFGCLAFACNPTQTLTIFNTEEYLVSSSKYMTHVPPSMPTPLTVDADDILVKDMAQEIEDSPQVSSPMAIIVEPIAS
ncbi:uncharacterized protein LOC141696550 [Apium graveolens]|uniref:uncharacterized protein LOC141696550 n=1 Tax=Apium graveolens TaxID=4045 RepID=UPI003D7A9338